MPTALIVPEAMREAPGPFVDVLRDAGFEIRYPKNSLLARGILSQEETIDELSVADATIASVEKYSEAVLGALPKLRVVARCGVGYDAVDVAAVTRRNIALTITPNANHEAVAELTLALLLGATKYIVSNDKKVRSGLWPRKLPMPIRGKTIGIFGLGRIGRSLAVRAAALGMHVLATEQFPNHDFVRAKEIELVDLDTLLARSDFVSVHAPLTDATRGLFNKTVFAKMKRGSIFLNTARGGLMVEADLLEALRSGHLRAAGLDVFEREPPAPDNPLFELDNVVLSPHIAGGDETSLVAMGVEAAQCIVSLYRGQWPEGAVVNSELRDRFQWQR